MRRLSIPILSLPLFISALYAFAAFAVEAPISAEQFQNQAKISWQSLKEEYRRGVSMEIALRYDDDPSGKIDIIIYGKNELNHFHRQREEIIVCNPEYAFRIEKGMSDETWTLTDFSEDPTKCENPQFVHGLRESSTHAFRGLFLEEGWLVELVSSDSFKIHSIKPTTRNGAEYVEVTFESEHYLDRNNQVLGGTMVFDPTRYWVLVESNVRINFIYQERQETTTRPHDVQTQIEYIDIDNIPFPKKVKTTYIHPGRNPIVLHIDYANVSRAEIPAEIFRLSYYGFSEPTRQTHWGGTFRIVTTVIAVLMILLGLYLRYLAKRRT